MRLEIQVIPGAKKNAVSSDGEIFKVHLTAPPVDGKANDLLIKVLAEHFHVKRSKVEIIKGLRSRNKVINIVSS